jgi:hypothetical protein
MRSSQFLTLSALILFLLPNLAGAGELKWTHYGIRPLAMGNAYVGVADDYNALFYNPAGLARIKSWHLEIFNPRFGVSSSTLNTMEDFTKLASSGSSTVDATIDAFETLTGKPQWINFGMTPYFIYGGFGLGLGLDVGGSMVIHRTIAADVDAGFTAIVPLSYATSFLEDRLSIGLSLKGAFKQGVEREFSLADITAFSNNSADSSGKKLKDYVIGGQGFGVDAGMLFTPTTQGDPTLGISVTDIGGTPLKASAANGVELGKPKPRDPSLNAGISFKPIKSGNYYVLTSIDAHALNQPLHFSKKLNFGAEWGLGSIFKLQAGLHQGSVSGGVEIDAWLLVFRFATYTEQLGSVAGENEDRRFLAQIKAIL